jgi:hypothetical protein
LINPIGPFPFAIRASFNNVTMPAQIGVDALVPPPENESPKNTIGMLVPIDETSG